MTKKWEYVEADGVLNTGPGNYTLQGDGFYISYAADTSSNIFGSPDDGPETALVKGDNFLILRGDWRNEYEALINDCPLYGYEACVAFWKSKQTTHRSKWTNEPLESVAH